MVDTKVNATIDAWSRVRGRHDGYERVDELKILVFDADGVVVIPPQRFLARYTEEEGLDPRSVRAFLDGALRECIAGRADLKEAIVPFLGQWGWKGTPEAFLRRWFEAEHLINEPLLEVIQRLRRRGNRCVVATNQERHRLAYMREQMGFGRLFDGVFGSSEVGAAKPDMAFYERVTTLLGVAPEEIVFWDDSESNVEGARAFGWQAELFTGMDEFLRTLRIHAGLSPNDLA